MTYDSATETDSAVLASFLARVFLTLCDGDSAKIQRIQAEIGLSLQTPQSQSSADFFQKLLDVFEAESEMPL